jgi:chromosomal replication initiator protein
LEYRIMVDGGNNYNKPVTVDMAGHSYKTFTNN